MKETAHSGTAVPSARLDLQLEFDGRSGLVSLRVDDMPVALADGTGTEHLALAAPSAITHSAPPARSLAERWSAFRSDARAYRLFLRLLRGALGTLILVGMIEWALYRYHFAQQPDFLGRYGWWILYLDINVVALATVLVYLRSFHLSAVSHMLGMMMGMTVGMQVGTMIGAVLGATNGFFIGAMVGMGFGGLSGIYIGCRCGSTMAVIQGLMSGVMAGTMGAMLIVMMLRDHVLFFMPVFTLANLLILMGFAYLFHEEAVESGSCRLRRAAGGLSLATLSVLTISVLVLLMLYGPKGPMVWTGGAHGAKPGTAMDAMPAMPGMGMPGIAGM
jgi:hypothetical protein